MAKPEIRKFMCLSTAHLSSELREGNKASWEAAVVYPLEYGFLLWVPDDPQESAQAMEDDVPDVILRIQLKARALGCDYVLFDSDGPELDGLETFE